MDDLRLNKSSVEHLNTTWKIDAKLVKKHHEETVAYIIHYKKALTENNKDFKRVLESLRVKEILIADKTSSQNNNKKLNQNYWSKLSVVKKSKVFQVSYKYNTTNYFNPTSKKFL